MRKLASIVVLVCLMVASAQAGLQSALAQAIRAIQIRPFPILRGPTPIQLAPEDALFIDPIASTLGDGVFREGPEFDYNPTTGSVSIFAPPMLGPADEFGIRPQYSPQSIRVFAPNFFSDAPSIPKVDQYVLNQPHYSPTTGALVPLDDNDPSFVIDESNQYLALSITPGKINVQFSSSYRLSGVEVDFSSLLRPELGADVFEIDEDALLANQNGPYSLFDEGDLSDVYFVVDYRSLGSSRRGIPTSYSLLAIPKSGLFPDTQAAVPEPSSMILACFAAFALVTQVRTRNR